jgi:hypothetical protein
MDQNTIQINYTHRTQGQVTATVESASALTVAKYLHDQGHVVESIVWYVRKVGERDTETVGVWYTPNETAQDRAA